MPCAGEKQGKSLLGADEPSLWYEGAAALPPMEPTAHQSFSQDEMEEKRLLAEDAMATEAAAFEKAFGQSPLEASIVMITQSAHVCILCATHAQSFAYRHAASTACSRLIAEEPLPQHA